MGVYADERDVEIEGEGYDHREYVSKLVSQGLIRSQYSSSLECEPVGSKEISGA